MRRFTRLTNAFSQKIENHARAVALHFMFYNFYRLHQTLRITPAMAAGITERKWEVSDIVALIEEATPKPNHPKDLREANSQAVTSPDWGAMVTPAIKPTRSCSAYS